MSGRLIAALGLCLFGIVGLVRPDLLIKLREGMGLFRNFDRMDAVYASSRARAAMRGVALFFLLAGVLLLFG
jgi:hypothetical protein